ncbi:DUF2892 domain-containing protein [Sulfurimonas sp.]|uniref:YgaP family membrane protein n=1 Tax=Sulfurimonas sp. TaxID=2022749 RepID=UPI003566BF1A
MCFNTGKIDRIIRIVVGVALIAYGLLADMTLLSLIGLIPLITGAVGFCPLYSIFKIDTGCKK